jgi:hypothetical protein
VWGIVCGVGYFKDHRAIIDEFINESARLQGQLAEESEDKRRH